MYTPVDILRYVVENKKEMDFMESIMMHKQNYSIAEITDKECVKEEEGFFLKSKEYKLNVKIEDNEIQTAILNKMYISAFISRKDEDYQIHFLVHKYPAAMKARFDDAILDEVVQYMIVKTIIALRLDTPQKADEYIG